MSTVVEQECDALRVGALGGPVSVEEILNGYYAQVSLLVPTRSPRNDDRGATLTRYRVYQTHI